MICEKSSDSGDLTSHPNTQFHASLTRAIIASLRAALYHADRITSRNRAAGIRMSGLQHGATPPAQTREHGNRGVVKRDLNPPIASIPGTSMFCMQASTS